MVFLLSHSNISREEWSLLASIVVADDALLLQSEAVNLLLDPAKLDALQQLPDNPSIYALATDCPKCLQPKKGNERSVELISELQMVALMSDHEVVHSL